MSLKAGKGGATDIFSGWDGRYAGLREGFEGEDDVMILLERYAMFNEQQARILPLCYLN